MSARRKRRHKRKRAGFWSWMSEHWILAGFFILPTLIMAPVALVKAFRPALPPAPPAPPAKPPGSP